MPPTCKTWVTRRTDTFVLYFQMEGLCAALKHGMEHGQAPGEEIRKYLSLVREHLQKRADGTPYRVLPTLKSTNSGGDLLCLAEILRMTLLAALTPEERTESKKFGFNQ